MVGCLQEKLSRQSKWACRGKTCCLKLLMFFHGICWWHPSMGLSGVPCMCPKQIWWGLVANIGKQCAYWCGKSASEYLTCAGSIHVVSSHVFGCSQSYDCDRQTALQRPTYIHVQTNLHFTVRKWTHFSASSENPIHTGPDFQCCLSKLTTCQYAGHLSGRPYHCVKMEVYIVYAYYIFIYTNMRIY